MCLKGWVSCGDEGESGNGGGRGGSGGDSGGGDGGNSGDWLLIKYISCALSYFNGAFKLKF